MSEALFLGGGAREQGPERTGGAHPAARLTDGHADALRPAPVQSGYSLLLAQPILVLIWIRERAEIGNVVGIPFYKVVIKSLMIIDQNTTL